VSPSVRAIGVALILPLTAASGLAIGWLSARLGSGDPPGPPVSPKTALPGPVRRATGAERSSFPREFSDAAGARPEFEDVAPRLQINFQYERGETGEFWLPETMGGGVAWLDYDGDGRQDLFFVQGGQLPTDDSPPCDVLFRNQLNAPWTIVPEWAAPSDPNYGMGAAAADVNNDGFDDLYVTNFGRHTLYINRGDGSFVEQGRDFGLHCSLWGTSAAWGDLDRDGDLDLFVANYVTQDPNIKCTDPTTGQRKYCGPDYYDGQPSVLFENLGNGRFQERTSEAGVLQTGGKGLGVVIGDLVGNDGWPEVFVANDLRPNFLFKNVTAEATLSNSTAGIRLEEVGFELGVAVNGEGVREANMGIACGDYDNNGWLDLYVTHYYMEHDTLWQNNAGSFQDVTRTVGLSLPTLNQLSWGTNALDYDNDGWLDLFVTSGHINNIQGGNESYAMRPQLFCNLGAARKRFVEVSLSAGKYFQERYVGRGSAAADFDSDGDCDVAVTHHHRSAALLENRTRTTNRALGLKLIGGPSNRSAVGTRIVITVRSGSGDRQVMRELVGGGSYLSSDSRIILIGVGPNERVAAVRLRWPSGETTTLDDVQTGGYWVVGERGTITMFEPFAVPAPKHD
jgi:hypothetical protein